LTLWKWKKYYFRLWICYGPGFGKLAVRLARLNDEADTDVRDAFSGKTILKSVADEEIESEVSCSLIWYFCEFKKCLLKLI